jgi:hypothetical protein
MQEFTFIMEAEYFCLENMRVQYSILSRDYSAQKLVGQLAIP